MGVQVRTADPGTHSPRRPRAGGMNGRSGADRGPGTQSRTGSARRPKNRIGDHRAGGAPQPTHARTQAGRRRPTANQTSMVAAARHLRPPRLRARAWVLLTLLLAAAAFGAWLWVRDSSLVRVDQVLVTGAT